MKQYGDELARELSHSFHTSVAALTDIDAIGADDRQDAQVVHCSTAADPSSWIFLAASTAVAGANVRVPSDAPATGRWHRSNSSATQSGISRSARNVVLTNTSLTAYTVASATLNDNVAGGNVVNDRVLLVGQTAPAENGPYIVGTPNAGVAPLTRAADWSLASVQPAAAEFLITEGTIFGGRKWFASLVGPTTVGTSSPAFYPRKYVRVTTAMSGSPGIKALTTEWILSATKSEVTPIVKVPGTQGFLSIGALTPGFGNGAVTITSTANETSTLQVTIEN